jgi:hypothetical protein
LEGAQGKKNPGERGNLQGGNALSLVCRYGPAQGGEAGGDESPACKSQVLEKSFDQAQKKSQKSRKIITFDISKIKLYPKIPRKHSGNNFPPGPSHVKRTKNTSFLGPFSRHPYAPYAP